MATGAVGAGCALWPFVNSMNPAADTQALASIEVDVSDLEPGQSKTVTWRGKPIFIRHRTETEIKQAKEASLKSLKDPQSDEERFGADPKWLVVVGICTHLGCVPTEQKSVSSSDGDGWFCACHGSKYDTSGRIVKGPAPLNLPVPPYKFVNDTTLLIG